jgi:hypothetical protein
MRTISGAPGTVRECHPVDRSAGRRPPSCAHRIDNYFEEIDMSKHIGSFDLRNIVENALSGLAFAAIVAVISAGTAAMCFPGLVA